MNRWSNVIKFQNIVIASIRIFRVLFVDFILCTQYFCFGEFLFALECFGFILAHLGWPALYLLL